MNWIALSIVSTIFFVAVNLLTTSLATRGVAPAVLNFWFFCLATLGFAMMAILRGESLLMPQVTFLPFITLALVALGYNDFLVRAFAVAPNPGYVQAILSLNMIAIVVFAALFLGSDISFTKIFGVLLVVSGILTLCLAK